VQARVDAMTDQEVHALATKLDQMPAGGDALGVLVLVFIILLITDAMGITDIFPFVKKPARR
ncbi:MAG: PA2779 family protein, partial [Pseudomonadota bacterium]